MWLTCPIRHSSHITSCISHTDRHRRRLRTGDGSGTAHGLEPQKNPHHTGTWQRRDFRSGNLMRRPGSCLDRDDSQPTHGGTQRLRRRLRYPCHLVRDLQRRHGCSLSSDPDRQCPRYRVRIVRRHRQRVCNPRKSCADAQRLRVDQPGRWCRVDRYATCVGPDADPDPTKLTLRPRSLDREET